MIRFETSNVLAVTMSMMMSSHNVGFRPSKSDCKESGVQSTDDERQIRGYVFEFENLLSPHTPDIHGSRGPMSWNERVEVRLDEDYGVPGADLNFNVKSARVPLPIF